MEIGFKRFLSDLATRRYRFRQAVGGMFGVFLLALARPEAVGLAIGSALCAGGLFIRLWAAGQVHKNESLATDGPYALVRHPQYLGNCFMAVGMSLATGHPWAMALWAALFVLFYEPAIRREDEKLQRRFGQRWGEWAARTPAVLPRLQLLMRLPSSSSTWSLRRAIRNGEPIWMLLSCVGLALLFLLLRQGWHLM